MLHNLCSAEPNHPLHARVDGLDVVSGTSLDDADKLVMVLPVPAATVPPALKDKRVKLGNLWSQTAAATTTAAWLPTVGSGRGG